jgi:tRNA1Val (adenine37-N6)-methyltransferase
VGNPYFRFKQFVIHHDRCAMKVTTDACLFGAWCAGIIKQELKIKTCLDIGTGTGLLSLMIAQKHNTNIDAIEIDDDAAQQAKENTESSAFEEYITVLHGDVLELTDKKKYDIIISNPPFYEEELISPDARKNSAHHSSQLKLSQLLEKINMLMKDDGYFFLLLPFKREEAVTKLLAQCKLFICRKVLVKQTENHSPFRIMIQGGKTEVDAFKTKEIIIKFEEKYTDDFIGLLKDHYLYL